MSDNVILAQQTIEGFAEIGEGAGFYGIEQEQALSLTAGETYTVLWDGTEYSCIAVSMGGAMALGNLSLAGISDVDSGEPFVIGCVPAALTGAADMLMIYTTDAAESHAVAIAVEGIVTFNRYGDKEYHYGIQTLTLDTTTEKHQRVHTKGVKAEKSVALDMADGDLIIEPNPGTLLGKVTVQKPETMTPENIRNGVEIGGVQGSFLGDTEEIIVDLNMADGDQVIVPSADGKVISKVTVIKPETLAPENVPEGVEIGGVEGSRSAGAVKEKFVNFYDYDGTLVASYTREEANELTELPLPLGKDGLSFQEWNYSLTQVKGTGAPLDVGATYITDDGKTRLFLELCVVSSLDVTLNFSQTVSSGVTLDWGDGNSETVSGTGNVSATHTYAGGQEYCLTLSPASGCTLGLGHGSSTSPLFVGGHYLGEIQIGSGVTELGAWVFHNASNNIKCLTIPKNVTRIGDNSLQYLYALRCVILPSSVTVVGNSFQPNGNNVTSLPRSITSVGTYFCTQSRVRRLIIPSGITKINKYTFNNMQGAEAIVLPSTITSFEKNCLINTFVAKIYAPDSVISSYKAMTNLSDFAVRIFPLSEYPG